MKHADALAAVSAACKVLNGADIPTVAVYYDEDGWHAAGPTMAGDVLARLLRAAADTCEQQLLPEGASLN